MSELILPGYLETEARKHEDLSFYDYKDFRCKVDKSEVYSDLQVYHGAASRMDGERGRVTFTVNDTSNNGCRKQLEYLIDTYYKNTRKL